MTGASDNPLLRAANELSNLRDDGEYVVFKTAIDLMARWLMWNDDEQIEKVIEVIVSEVRAKSREYRSTVDGQTLADFDELEIH